MSPVDVGSKRLFVMVVVFFQLSELVILQVREWNCKAMIHAGASQPVSTCPFLTQPGIARGMAGPRVRQHCRDSETVGIDATHEFRGQLRLCKHGNSTEMLGSGRLRKSLVFRRADWSLSNDLPACITVHADDTDTTAI